MKKFMFSAVALVAFSFAGMANTDGEEKIEYKEVETLEINTPGISDCLGWAYDQVARVEKFLNHDFGWEAEMAMVIDLLDDCPQ